MRRTLATKLVGYALGRTVQASDQLLIDRMVATGGNATFSQLAARDRHQPPVPQSSRTGRRSRRAHGQNRRGSGAEILEWSQCTMKTMEPDHTARRNRAVISCAARASLSLCPGWNRCPCWRRTPRRSRRRPPTSLRCASPASTFRTASSPTHWWAKGSGASMEFGPAAAAARRRSARTWSSCKGLYNQTALVSTSPHLGRMNMLSGATVSLDPNDIRVGTTHGSGAGAAASATRPRCPAWRSASSPTNCAWKTASP